ncbi:hypothetical protein SELMODRAFT_99282, partial [Selaginella moellendorffii]
GAMAVVWDEAALRFRTPDGAAYLSYSKKKDGSADLIDLEHTYVPPSKRGQGIAAQLCEAAFDCARKQGFRVIPTCSYISETFLPRNPQWSDVVFQQSTM